MEPQATDRAGRDEGDPARSGKPARDSTESSSGSAGSETVRALLKEALDGLLGELVEGAPDAIVIHDGDVVHHVNQRALELIGNPPAEWVVGHRLWEFLPQEYHDLMRARIEQMRETSGPTPLHDVPLYVPGQGRYWGEFVSSPFQIEGQTLFQTAIRDATKRKEAELARAESEARYRSLFDAVPVGLYRSRPDGTILDANLAFVEMLRYPDRETLLSTPAYELYVDAEERTAWIDDIRAMEDTELPDIRLRTYDGDEVRARLTARLQRTETGEIDCFEGALQDVTDSHRAKARFQFLFETMAQGVVFHDSEGRLTLVNPAGERILGQSAEELRGRSSTDPDWVTYNPDGTRRPAEHGPVSRALRDGRPARGEVIGIRNPQSDEIRWIEMDAYPMYGADGDAVQQVYAVFADITDRRQAEDELRRSEQRLERALTGSNLGLWDWDVATGELYLDARWFEMLGYAPGELDLDYEGWLELIYPEDREPVQEALKRHLKGEDPFYEIELRIRARDGSWRWILDRGQVIERTADGTALRAAGTHTDITERKRAEEALRRSEERLASIVRAAPLGITLSRLDDGLFLEVNEEFADLLGYHRDDLLGSTSRELGLWDDPKDRQKAEEEIAREGRLRGFPVRFRTRDGDVRQVQLSTELVEMGGDLCVLTMHQDVTEARRLEEQFRQAQKMEAVGRLAGGIAHDFNNLLTAMVGHVGFLLDGLPEDTPLRDEVEGIREGAERAERLTRQLLAFSRQQMLNPRLVDLRDVLDSFEPLLQRLIGEDVILDVTHGEACWVRVDPGQLEQVVLNLAVNARDAMPDGGRLAIHARCVDVDGSGEADRGDTVPPGRYARLTVTDTGTGMDEETLDHIFDPFYTTKPLGKGTGLGLSTVYGIISQSAGHVHVSSERGEGTTFTIHLPAVEAGPAEEQRSAAELEREALAGSEAVLLVEDEDAVRNLAARVLERSGYVVHAAADGRDALELLKGLDRVDLLITDVVMPGMGGRELAERAREQAPELPVVYMSGYTADEVVRDRELRSGTFLEKPFTPDELIRRVRSALDG